MFAFFWKLLPILHILFAFLLYVRAQLHEERFKQFIEFFCIFTKNFANYVCSLPMCTITYEEGSEAIWCIWWRGASPQIAGKGELAEETNKHGGAKSFGGNSRLWRRDALPASESLRESLGD